MWWPRRATSPVTRVVRGGRSASASLHRVLAGAMPGAMRRSTNPTPVGCSVFRRVPGQAMRGCSRRLPPWMKPGARFCCSTTRRFMRVRGATLPHAARGPKAGWWKRWWRCRAACFPTGARRRRSFSCVRVVRSARLRCSSTRRRVAGRRRFRSEVRNAAFLMR